MEVSGNGHLTHVSSPKHPTYIWYFKKSHATVPLQIGYQLDGYRAACSEVCLVSNPKLKAKDWSSLLITPGVHTNYRGPLTSNEAAAD
jgi:hypothetical protein